MKRLGWVSQFNSLWLFLAGLIAGTQFSLQNIPFLTVVCFAFFYRIALSPTFTPKERWVNAYSYGFGFFMYSHSWISQPFTVYGEMYAWMQPIAFIGVPAILALYYLPIAWVAGKFTRESCGRVAALTTVTFITEYLRCEYAPSVPLGQIGTVWLTYPVVSQFAALLGVYGLSWVTLFISYAIGIAQGKLRRLIPAVVLSLVLVFYGQWRIATIDLQVDNRVIRIVPAAIDQITKYGNLDQRVQHLQQIISRTQHSNRPQPVLIVWPETIIEFPLLQHKFGHDFMYPEIKLMLKHNLPPQSTLVAGIIFRPNSTEAYNAIFGYSSMKGIFYVYKKRALAPFTERMPPFLRPIVEGLNIIAMDDFNRGDQWQPLLKLSENLNVRTLICYEGSFSSDISLPSHNVGLITVSTNDDWFRYNGKEQQFISHAFRAIEQGVPLVRAANNGFSGYVSPIGTYRVSLAAAPIDTKFHQSLPHTIYRKLSGYVPYWIEILCFIHLCCVALSVRRRRFNR